MHIVIIISDLLHSFPLFTLSSFSLTHIVNTSLHHCSSSEQHRHHHFTTEPCGSQLPHTPSWRHSGCRRTCSVSLWGARSFSEPHFHLLRESRQLQPHLSLWPHGRHPPGEVVAVWFCIYSNASLYPRFLLLFPSATLCGCHSHAHRHKAEEVNISQTS